ncbi:hypothetical protein [Candidatus Leptofilum sp.]|uniref:hypothetical protein n=1 Tax=Candidatus Leptofilum sp. TaxID=3241576 RepID=UPI003B5BD07C
MNQLKQWLRDTSNQIGLIVGILGLPISFLGQDYNLGRELADPLPVVLGVSQAMRDGFLYLNWRGIAWHLFFVIFLIFLLVGIVRLRFARTEWAMFDYRAAAQVAVVLNVGVVALLAVDAFVVALWYGMAGLLSVLLARLLAGGVAKIMSR